MQETTKQMKLLTACPTKAESRLRSIIEPWKELSGQAAIPADMRYVTLCGPMSGDGVQLFPSCELLHVVQAGLVEPPQFHGIEKDAVVHLNNQSAVEKEFSAGSRPHLYNADLIDVLSNMAKEPFFRPAIVNVDLQQGPEGRGIWYLARTLSILNLVPGPTLVVWNVVVQHPYRKLDMRDGFAALPKHEHFQNAYRDGGWLPHGELEYRRGHTTMRSIVLWRPAKTKGRAA